MHVDVDVLTYSQGLAHEVDTCQRQVMKEELVAFQGIQTKNFVVDEYNTNGYLGADNVGECFVGAHVGDDGNNQQWILVYVEVYTDLKYWTFHHENYKFTIILIS